jgi:PIN domain nuclease of toxin-antitoxin system
VIVYDSSALIAYLLDEPGGVMVGRRLDTGGAVGAANWSETMQKMATKNAWAESRDVLLSFPIRIEAVDRADAEGAARLWRRGSGLSLADRLCLALGERLDSEVLTADQTWDGQPRVRLIR